MNNTIVFINELFSKIRKQYLKFIYKPSPIPNFYNLLSKNYFLKKLKIIPEL